jgi:uncharacterized protein (DUF2235 family)
MPKNIVLCFDGTSDEVNSSPSNVLRLFQTLDHGPSQVIYYQPGIGTLMDPKFLSPWSKMARKGLDLAAGFGIREKVIDGCTFLAQSYEEGDRIFLFGFSRGAYTARAVAGMIKMFGLPRKEHLNLLPYVWQRFAKNDSPPGSDDERALFKTAGEFRDVFGMPVVSIYFVGVFDTVSSVGFFGMYRTFPYTRHNDQILHFRHATAIDEHRAHFPLNAAESVNSSQDYVQVWFSGVHDDVGGGQPDEEAALAKVPLEWMLGEASSLGLALRREKCDQILTNPAPNPLYKKSESLSWIWWFIGLFPMRTWSDTDHRNRWHWPNFKWLRPIAEGSLVHESVDSKIAGDHAYSRPPNLPSNYVIASTRPLTF